MMKEATQKFYRFFICFFESKKSTPYCSRNPTSQQIEAIIVSGIGAIARKANLVKNGLNPSQEKGGYLK